MHTSRITKIKHIGWAALCAALLLTACAGPPVQEMSDARQAIQAAEDAGADDKAPMVLQQARDYLVSAGYLASDNDFKYLYDNHTKYNPNDDKWVKRNNAQFDQGNVLAKFGYDIDDDMRISFLAPRIVCVRRNAMP